MTDTRSPAPAPVATASPNEPSPPVLHRLVQISVVLAILTVLHDLDHVRQGRTLPPELYVVGVVALVSIGTTLGVLLRHPAWARPVAIAQGVTTFVGIGAVHAAPQWSTVTDSYAAAHADALSWTIILATMLAGLALTIVAARDRRTAGEPARTPG